ncbi:MAG: type II secretion system protein N [Thermodesulfobacteriota bacterium]
MKHKAFILISFLLATGLAVGAVEYFCRTLEKSLLTGEQGKELAVATEDGKSSKKITPKAGPRRAPLKKITARQTKDEYAIITKRALFGKVKGDSASREVVEEVKPEPAPTSMDLVLLGTISGSSNEQRAIIRNKKKGKQDIYYKGDAIEKALIKEIHRGKIILEVNGREEVLLMQESKSPKGSAAKRKNGKAETYTLADAMEEEEKRTKRRIPKKRLPTNKKTLKIDLNPQEENNDE